MNDEFRIKFKNLVESISEFTDNKKIEKSLNDIINYYEKVLNVNYPIYSKRKEDLLQAGCNTFMTSSGDNISYSVELMKEIINKIKNGKTSDYNPMYNDIVFSLYIISGINHELWHCIQNTKIENGDLSWQTYINALSFSVNHFIEIPYVEKCYEGEAYGAGVTRLNEVCNEENLGSWYYQNLEFQNKSFNFFTKNINYANTFYWLNKIPFITNNNTFVDLITYSNEFISKLDKQYIMPLFEKYPLISVGLDSKGNIKTADILMKQYFDRVIEFGNFYGPLNDVEQESLKDIYIYLLLPKVDLNTYNDLCLKYGKKEINGFLEDMKVKIDEKSLLFETAKDNSIQGIKFLEKSNLLKGKGVDINYIISKEKQSQDFLIKCRDNIDMCLDKKKII